MIRMVPEEVRGRVEQPREVQRHHLAQSSSNPKSVPECVAPSDGGHYPWEQEAHEKG